MAGKEETSKCRKKTVTWTNEMIEDLIDFMEIHPIVAFEAIYELHDTSFASMSPFKKSWIKKNLNSSLYIHDERNFDE
jgi:hypothetical protein